MKNIHHYVIASFAILIVPFIAYANGLIEVFQVVQTVLSALIPISITLALVYFIWGISQFILVSGNDEKREEGKQKIIWGIISIFVIVSIWGIVNFIGSSFGIGTGGTVTIPMLPTQGGTGGGGGGSSGGSQLQQCIDGCGGDSSCIADCNFYLN